MKKTDLGDIKNNKRLSAKEALGSREVNTVISSIN
jgi:hypothetical protein